MIRAPMETLPNNVFVKRGTQDGPTLAVVAGVHGNERVGVMALQALWPTLEIVKGTVYAMYANPEAIAKNVRFIEKNLNRCFMHGNVSTTLEERRAQELLPIFDTCDAVLDLHATNSVKTTPFLITEQPSMDLARALDFPIISTGWNEAEGGAVDGYVYERGKIAVTTELGSVKTPELYLDLAKQSILTFLRYYGCIEGDVPTPTQTPKYVHIVRSVLKQTNALSFAKDFADFEALPEGDVFAKDGDTEYRAGKGECIIFPRPEKEIGGEAF
ncbi:MAG: succinylglutamate desuccinylase/aspartoacylase family protein, partial [Patescibacteria group bacterium]